MSGIGNYFHGETAEAAELFWFADENRLYYDMLLREDPHRERTSDYGSDIGIDPQIKPGSQVVYVRLDETCGLWVEKGNEFTPRLAQALARCKENRHKYIHEYRSFLSGSKTTSNSWTDWLAKETGLLVHTAETFKGPARPASERPSTAVSVFLSYRHQDVLLARDFYDYLRDDAKADVWIDLAQAGKAPTPGEEVEVWLRRAVYSSQLFLILMTKAALASEWVMKEFVWAGERAESEKEFHPILLNLENLPPPPGKARMSVLDCKYLSLGEILEEVYALMYERKGRREWLEEQLQRGWDEPQKKPYDFKYGHTAAGEAVALNWSWQGKELHWVLTYLIDNQETRVEGHGRDQIVDLGIKPGNRIAYYVFNQFFPVWMRSDDLSLSVRDVARDYSKVSGSPPADAVPLESESASDSQQPKSHDANLGVAPSRQMYFATTEVTLTPDSPGHALLHPSSLKGEISLDRASSRLDHLSEWVLIIGGLLVIALAEASFFRFVYASILSGVSDPPMDARLAATILPTMKAFLALNILLFGIYFLIKIHAVSRTDEVLVGIAGLLRAFATVIPMALVTTILPLLAFAGIQILYMLTLKLGLQLLQRIFGGDWSGVIWYGSVACYGLFLIYFGFRTWRLLKRELSVRSTIRLAKRHNQWLSSQSKS